jgi:hypothetical protein
MMGAAGFLDSFVKDEVKCRCLTEEDFGQPIDNSENDVPLYDMYNRGLVATQQGLERNPLNIEGMDQRSGLTGYIPSAEEALSMGGKPKPKALVMELGEPDEDEIQMSMKRRGLMR